MHPGRTPASLFARAFIVVAFTAFLAAANAPLASAQMNMPMPAMETRDEIAPDQLPPPEKLAGIGNAHMQITATPEAQMWFDQGLNLLHDYWDYESEIGRAH